MKQKITLKKLAINDRKKYLELFLIADESEEMVALYLNEGEADLIQLKGKTVGVVLFTFPDPQSVEVKNIAILQKHQNNGFGKQVLAIATDRYAAKGFHFLLVGTANSSISNIAFYQKAGFRLDSIKKDFFLHYSEVIIEDGIQAKDMLVFKKDLTE
ncbi:GNAT family N-acetyltransferase [Carnobacterium mobile]|uniref:GNAT family N-acetyltransferase n=1 Tax=Carnobacterium mobile TaxID=2750 RepID=UPI000554C6F2|nr:GNAT family N-acetyltransferase [Carnobacterium mobile]